MTKRLDAKIGRQYKGKDGAIKTTYTKIGVAFYNDKLGGHVLELEALPLPQLYTAPGKEPVLQCRILLVPPKEDKPAATPTASAPFADDEIPF